MNTDKDTELLNRLLRHPEIRERVESILDVAESKVKGSDTADSVERRVVEEVRQLGAEIVTDWGRSKAEKETEAQRAANPAARPYKKKVVWHTTFGPIEVNETVLEIYGRSNRPFSQSAGVTARSCSELLQRRIVDFAADVPFHEVPNKMKEHYGFEICQEVIRKQTLRHAEQAGEFFKQVVTFPTSLGVKTLIAECDGGMVPIVTVDESSEVSDKRKTRKTSWKEAKLCFSRDVNSVTATFLATIGSPDELGDRWFTCAVTAGLGTKTKVHCVGDGAPWIKDQVDRIFSDQGGYLVDFYHLSEYLAEAGRSCFPSAPKAWLHEQQDRMKRGDIYLVLQELEGYLNPIKGEEPLSVRACYRYMTNRLDQLNYLDALEEDLPIGSGEIESAHRHVVQKRMKRAGAWWKVENAEKMLQLLTLRANGLWTLYWEDACKEEFSEAA